MIFLIYDNNNKKTILTEVIVQSRCKSVYVIWLYSLLSFKIAVQDLFKHRERINV